MEARCQMVSVDCSFRVFCSCSRYTVIQSVYFFIYKCYCMYGSTNLVFRIIYHFIIDKGKTTETVTKHPIPKASHVAKILILLVKRDPTVGATTISIRFSTTL